MPRDEQHRSQRNDMSRNKATHYAEPWSQEELEFLESEWDGSEETLETIAEILGRTIEACRQKHYLKETRGHARTKQHNVGWLYSFCTGCGTFTDVYCNGFTQYCEDCKP